MRFLPGVGLPVATRDACFPAPGELHNAYSVIRQQHVVLISHFEVNE